MMNRRSLLILWLLLFSIASLAHAQEKKPERVNVAYASATTNTVHLWIARDLGLFEKYGLDANLVYISGSATALQALVGGDVDVVYGTGAAAVAGAVRGARIAIIATSGPTDYVLVGRPSLKSVDELKGKTIGISNFAGSDYFALRRLLPKLGLTPNRDVTLLPIGIPNPVEKVLLVLQGKIDATLGNPVTVIQYEVKGQKLSVLAEVIPNRIYVTSGDIIVRQDFVNTQRQKAKAFLRAFSEAIWRAKSDKELVFQTLRKHLKIQNQTLLEAVYERGVRATLPRGAPYPIEEAIQFAIEDIGGVSPELAKAKALKASDFIDAGLLKEIEVEGFFARFRY